MNDEVFQSDDSVLPLITCAELDAQILETINSIRADMDAFEERAALQAEALDDHKTTTERALEALHRPERFNGEHDVAVAWLKQNEPNGRYFQARRRNER